MKLPGRNKEIQMKKEKGLKIEELGEFGFIAWFSPAFLQKLPREVLGIGDDCAVIPYRGSKRLVVTTDMLVEGVHFLKEKIPGEDLGYKSLAVNLSDIAAMGAKPLYSFLSVAMPAETEISWLAGFFRGWKKLSRQTGVFLLGGDTTSSPEKIIISVTVIGIADEKNLRYRSSARPGDVVAVTGNLGDSEGGLRLLLSGREVGPFSRSEKLLIQRHFRPRPHLEEGQFLATKSEVRAMMDVSDGIDSDLRRIMEQSACGAEVYVEKLPVSMALKNCSQKYSWPRDEIAAAGGEDYCLLVSIDKEKFPRLAENFSRRFRRPLAAIGKITPEKGRLVYLKDGRPYSLKKSGFDHFKK